MKYNKRKAQDNYHTSEERGLAIELMDVTVNIPVQSSKPKSIKGSLLKAITGGMIEASEKSVEIAALRGINCKIKHGERLALVGHNGAGKSTFLRLISGIYNASKGKIIANCNVYPMIQRCFVTGPDLDGAHAIKAHYLLLYGNLRGYSEYFKDVVEFAGLGDFIYMPMKGYSQGMSARLLFALMTADKHDCLALDEGFGAGDARFFKKAEERLKEFVEAAGTLVLASHSDELLKMFCTRGLVFSQGTIAYDGPLNDALDYYHDAYN